ncbi:hypothetical protein GCM10009665_33020 [Kitasatospora nipponensis]|uniref:Uncharacterized protein n=1 Tax=Kitasatospora nipponensis TaxID=258049 RepID=A0ABP4GVB4_9ACTN
MSRMTLGVYRVTPTGRRIDLVPVREVRPANFWEINAALIWPQCVCARCGPAPTARRHQ